jgi:hypothetical protein
MHQAALARPRYVDYRTRGFGSHRFMTGSAAEHFGRLVRTSKSCGDKSCGDPKPVAYIVAVAKPDDAMELVRTEIAKPGDTIEDLGRVSDALLRALNLSSGEFVRADAPHRA